MPVIYAPQRAQFLVEALSHIRAFRGETFVIGTGRHAATHSSTRSGFARDVAILQLAGVNVVVVHEGGLQHGREIAGLINRHGGKALGLSSCDWCFIQAGRSHPRSADCAQQERTHAGRSGEIERIDSEPLKLLHSSGFVPVVMPVGVGSGGESCDLSPDAVAAGLAEALGAEKLMLMTNAPGILDRHGVLCSDLTAAAIEGLFADGTIECGWPPKLAPALHALRHGVRAAHVINGRLPGALLLEVLTSEGVGTMIRSDGGFQLLPDRRH